MGNGTVSCRLCNGKYESISPEQDDNQGQDCQFSYDGFNDKIGKHEFSGGYFSNYDDEVYIGDSDFNLKKHDCICNICAKQKIDKKEIIYCGSYLDK
jgi:hypothetical protein